MATKRTTKEISKKPDNAVPALTPALLKKVPKHQLESYLKFGETVPVIKVYEDQMGAILESWGNSAIALSSQKIVDSISAGIMPLEATLYMRIAYLENTLRDFVRDVATHPVGGAKIFAIRALRAALRMGLQEAKTLYEGFEKQAPLGTPIPEPEQAWRDDVTLQIGKLAAAGGALAQVVANLMDRITKLEGKAVKK